MSNIKKLEALLFVSGNEGLSEKDISKLLEIKISDTRELVSIYSEKLKNEESALKLAKFGDLYKLTTKKELNKLLSKFIDNKPNNLSQSSLETLAIIAYKSPITRVEIEEIRGVDCYFVVSKLMAANLIEEIGRASTPGAPILYNVTSEFMDIFKINSLSDLPSLEKFKDKYFDGQDIYKTKFRDVDDD